MAKVTSIVHNGENWIRYYCPGCKLHHTVPGKKWDWNCDIDYPTLSPSVKHMYTTDSEEDKVCHYFIKNGLIEYCGDCSHDLKGQKMELPDLE